MALYVPLAHGQLDQALVGMWTYPAKPAVNDADEIAIARLALAH